MKNMKLLRRVAISFVLALVLTAGAVLLVPPAAIAGDHDHHDRDDHIEARELLQRGEILPLSRILDIVGKRVAGDVIEVELERSHHHGWEYEVKVLTASGRVREVKLNAGSGVIRKIEDD